MADPSACDEDLCPIFGSQKFYSNRIKFNIKTRKKSVNRDYKENKLGRKIAYEETITN